MSQRFVVSFEPGRDGRPIGKRPRDGGDWVVLDRSNTELIHTYKKYLVEVANTLPGKRLRFVRVVMSVQDLFLELLPALLVAQWQRGKDEFSSPWTEIRSLNWGLAWYASNSTTRAIAAANTSSPMSPSIRKANGCRSKSDRVIRWTSASWLR